MMLLDSE